MEDLELRDDQCGNVSFRLSGKCFNYRSDQQAIRLVFPRCCPNVDYHSENANEFSRGEVVQIRDWLTNWLNANWPESKTKLEVKEGDPK